MRRLQRIKERFKAVKKGKKRIDFTRLTEHERKVLSWEISERLKDVVFAKAEIHATEFVDRIGKWAVFLGDDTINFNFTVTMVYNDILQILGRVRRP